MLAGFAWPLLIWFGAGWTSGDFLLPARVEEWLEERELDRWERRQLAAERAPASPEDTTGAMVFTEGLAPGPLETTIAGSRWWRWRPVGAPLLVTEQDDFVFQPHWCVYEVAELEPLLVAAIPRETARVIHDVVGDDSIVPRSPWEFRQGASDYEWKPVPAYVERPLGATAAWVGRQRAGAWL